MLKIDTEGYELEVLKGLKDQISKVSIILFEHHYDNMIVKNYKFGDIHHVLKNNGFSKVYKIKMPLRKSFRFILKKMNNHYSIIIIREIRLKFNLPIGKKRYIKFF